MNQLPGKGLVFFLHGMKLMIKQRKNFLKFQIKKEIRFYDGLVLFNFCLLKIMTPIRLTKLNSKNQFPKGIVPP